MDTDSNANICIYVYIYILHIVLISSSHHGLVEFCPPPAFAAIPTCTLISTVMASWLADPLGLRLGCLGWPWELSGFGGRSWGNFPKKNME